MSSIKKNYILSTVVPFLNSIFPLIVIPYASRVLGPENLGKVNFALSWISLFVTFGSFGISFHATREIAKNRENTKKLKIVFSEILLLQILTNLIASVAYTISIFLINDLRKDIPLFLIVGIQLFFNFASLSWFFIGIEKFGYISLRNFIFKLISLTLLFVIVKEHSDYREFAFVMGFSIVGSNLLDLILSFKYINLDSINTKEVFKHIKPSLIFLLSSLFSILYNGIDMIALQFMKPHDYEKALGIFGISKRIVVFTIFVINSFINVNLSRSAYYLGINDQESYKKFLVKSSKFVIFLTLPTSAIIFILSKEILSIIGGDKFIEGYLSLSLLALAVPIVIPRNILESQILNPNNKEKFILLGSVFSFFSFIILSYLLIQKHSYIGLSLVFSIAYSLDLAILTILSWVKLKIFPFDKSSLTYLFNTILLSAIFTFTKNLISVEIQKIALHQVVIDAIVFVTISGSFLLTYYLISLLEKDEIAVEVFDLAKKILVRK